MPRDVCNRDVVGFVLLHQKTTSVLERPIIFEMLFFEGKRNSLLADSAFHPDEQQRKIVAITEAFGSGKTHACQSLYHDYIVFHCEQRNTVNH